MFSLFKKNKVNTDVPEWAAFFNNNEYVSFLQAVDAYFKKENLAYECTDGMVTVGVNDFGFSMLGLTNIAQVCKQNKPRNYERLVYEHFQSMARANQFDAEFATIVHDYDSVKHYIGVRLYPIDYAAQIGKESTIGKDYAGDIYAMLVFDLPDSVINVRPEQAEKWGKGMDELFEVGLQNCKNKYQFDISLQKFSSIRVWFVQGDHFFTPNVVFDLGNYPKLIGTKGTLIGIPHRHSVVLYPIENLEVVTAINQLIPTIYGMNAEGPGSISNNLFWYYEGQVENLPYTIEDNKLQFFPPDNFMKMLQTLPKKP